MRQRQCKNPKQSGGVTKRQELELNGKKGDLHFFHRGEEPKLTIKSYPIFIVLAQQEHIHY